MKYIFSLCLIVCFLRCGAQNFNYHKDYDSILKRTRDIKDNLYYRKLLGRFNKYDTSMTDAEVLALMIGYTGQPQFAPYSDLSTERKIYQLNDERKYDEVLEITDSFVITHPLSQKTLLERSYAFHKKGENDSAANYAYRCKRILKAMAWSADGLTPETAIFTVGPADGQDFITKYLEGEIGSMGSGRDSYGNFLDILTIKPKEKKSSYKMYFAIQPASSSLMQEFKTK